MAHITPGFSFAFLQECFVATLLVLAQGNDNARAKPYDDDNDDLDDYKLWTTFRKQADMLRKEVDSEKPSQLTAWCKGESKSTYHIDSPTQVAKPENGHACCQCEKREPSSLSAAMRDLKVRNDILPELPYYNQKARYINSAAFELR